MYRKKLIITVILSIAPEKDFCIAYIFHSKKAIFQKFSKNYKNYAEVFGVASKSTLLYAFHS